jgi:hypothetical protein
VAAFDLMPGGSPTCLLDLPAGCELVHATVESLPALARRQSETRWQLSLGPQQLPQRVELIYRGRPGGSVTHKLFAAPRLAELDPDEVLWTVYSPPGFGVAVPRDSKWAVDPAEQQLKRIESAVSLVQLPPEIIGEHLPEEIARWYGPWRRRYGTARAALRGESTVPRRLAAPSGQDAKAGQLDKQMAQIDARFGATRVARGGASSDAARLLAEQCRSQTGLASFATSGKTPSLELRYPNSPLDPALGRWLLAIGLLTTGGAATYWLRNHKPRLLPAWAVIAGLAGLAWLALAPSFWGLAALGLIGLWQLRRHWPRTLPAWS